MDHVQRAISADPWVIQDFADRHSLLKVLLQHPGDQMFGLVGARLPDGVGEVEGLVEYLVNDGVVLLTDERRVARQQHEQEDAQGPDVALAIVELVYHLGSDVVDLHITSLTVPVHLRSRGWLSSNFRAEPKSISLSELNFSL